MTTKFVSGWFFSELQGVWYLTEEPANHPEDWVGPYKTFTIAKLSAIGVFKEREYEAKRLQDRFSKLRRQDSNKPQ